MSPRAQDIQPPASLTETADAIAAGRLTALEATEAALYALDTTGRRLNCVMRLDGERALETASGRDAGARLGPLHGVPMAHKDMFDRIGHVSRWGSAGARRPATRTAPLLARLDALGAVDLGSLHMTEFALDSVGDNDHFGRCVNPLTPDRIVGGSSSGVAAAVSAGLVPTGLGSDTGGSIRIPSAFCGLFGLKPTNGLLDMEGVMPLAPTLDCAGPIARNATDIAVMMSALADHKPFGFSGSEDWLTILKNPRKAIRVGVLDGYFSELNSEPVRTAMANAAGRFAQQGVALGDTSFPDIEACIDDLIPIMRGESLRWHAGALSAAYEAVGSWTTQRLYAGLEVLRADYERGLANRSKWTRRFLDEAFGEFDILACATIPILAPKVHETETDNQYRNGIVATIGRNTRPFNYLGLPALNVPIGNGIGIGMQLVGRPYSEPLLLQVAHQLEAS